MWKRESHVARKWACWDQLISLSLHPLCPTPAPEQPPPIKGAITLSHPRNTLFSFGGNSREGAGLEWPGLGREVGSEEAWVLSRA